MLVIQKDLPDEKSNVNAYLLLVQSSKGTVETRT